MNWIDNPDIISESSDRSLISVIIPCYNQAHFLSEAIDSVLAQTYASHEIIVIDDGSLDNTAEIAARYSNVQYIRQGNQGLSGARNAGIRQSHGGYLVFLDADDRLLPDALQAGLDCFCTHPECALVSGHHRYISYDGSLLNEYPPEPIDDDAYMALLKRNYIGMHAAVMYRRSVFDQVGGFDTTLTSCEDYEIYLRIARKFPIYRHHRMVAEYRWHTSNMSSNSARMLQMALAVLHAQRRHIKDKPQYVAACRSGIRYWRSYFGHRMITGVRTSLQTRQWNQLGSNLWMLAKYYPRWFVALAMEAALSIQSVRYALHRLHHNGSRL